MIFLFWRKMVEGGTMTYSKKREPKNAAKCSVVGCNEPASISIPKYRNVSTLTSEGILPVGTQNWCKYHAPGGAR
jgi:hypothetical protein